MRVLAVRVMMTNIDGKMSRAVLQHYIESGNIQDGTYRCVWKNVRELPVNPDGVVTLGAAPEQVAVPQVFQDAFRDEELHI